MHAAMLQLIGANWTTKAIVVAVELQIAEHLAGGSVPLDRLAELTGCHAPSLRRLMKALASLGLCREERDDGFSLEPIGEMLNSSTDSGLSDWALWWGKYNWTTWDDLLHCVRTGKSARELRAGTGNYAHVEKDTEAARIFNRAMVQVTARVAHCVAKQVRLKEGAHIVDVGGGHGVLLETLLTANPSWRGTLVELSHAQAGARKRFEQAGLLHRTELITASFFDGLPNAADGFFLKSILHNWDDQKCASILENCRNAIVEGGRLVVIERLLPETMSVCADDQAVARADLNMLVGLGGRERTRHEFESLFATAGFELVKCTPVGLDFHSIEAIPVNSKNIHQ